jgi:hypothetical protein
MTLFGEIQRDKVLAGWLMDLFTYRQGARRKKKIKETYVQGERLLKRYLFDADVAV